MSDDSDFIQATLLRHAERKRAAAVMRPTSRFERVTGAHPAEIMLVVVFVLTMVSAWCDLF